MFDKISEKEVRLIKSVRVFISSQKGQLIIAPQYKDKRHLIVEQEKCFAYEFPIDCSELGNKLRDCLNLFYYKDEVVITAKKTDWPAYKVSKCNTVQSFEKAYIYISIRSVNDRNLILEIEGFPYPNSILSVKSAVSFPPPWNGDELAKRVLLVYEACKNKSFD